MAHRLLIDLHSRFWRWLCNRSRYYRSTQQWNPLPSGPSAVFMPASQHRQPPPLASCMSALQRPDHRRCSGTRSRQGYRPRLSDPTSSRRRRPSCRRATTATTAAITAAEGPAAVRDIRSVVRSLRFQLQERHGISNGSGDAEFPDAGIGAASRAAGLAAWLH